MTAPIDITITLVGGCPFSYTWAAFALLTGVTRLQDEHKVELRSKDILFNPLLLDMMTLLLYRIHMFSVLDGFYTFLNFRYFSVICYF